MKEEKEMSETNEFSHETNELEFKSRHHYDIHTTTVYLLHPPCSLAATTLPFITAAINDTLRHNLHHPLTSTPYHHHHHLPPHFNLLKLRPAPTVLSVSHYTPCSFDKLLVVPLRTPNFSNVNYFKYNHVYDDLDLYNCTLFALYDGGQLRGCPPYAVNWTKLSCGPVDRFDDIVICKGKIYVVDREGRLYSLHKKLGFDETLIDYPLVSGPGLGLGLGWRKRLVVCRNQLFLVVRVEEKSLEVYKLVSDKNAVNFNWVKVEVFYGGEVLFIGRDCYFFWELTDGYCGRELENCILFSEGAFPKYGDGCWELSRFGNVRKCEDDIAVFRLSDGSFSRDGENGEFPMINWLPPAWIYDVWSGLAADYQSRSSSKSYCQSKREPEEDKGFDSDSKDENNGQMQSDLIGQDKKQKVIEFDSDSRH